MGSWCFERLYQYLVAVRAHPLKEFCLRGQIYARSTPDINDTASVCAAVDTRHKMSSTSHRELVRSWRYVTEQLGGGHRGSVHNGFRNVYSLDTYSKTYIGQVTVPYSMIYSSGCIRSFEADDPAHVAESESRIFCTIYEHVFPGLNLYCTDAAQQMLHNIPSRQVRVQMIYEGTAVRRS